MLTRRRMSVALLGTGLAVILSPALVRADTKVMERAIGRADAPVTIIEYASLTCPHCASFHKDVLPGLKARYVDTGKARLVYRDFPLDQVALKAAIVAHCAGDERYFRFLDALFSSQERWAHARDPVAAIKQLARLGGVSEAEADACLANPAMEEGVLRSRLEGQKQFNVNSTPSFVINGKPFNGGRSVDDFAKEIDPLVK